VSDTALPGAGPAGPAAPAGGLDEDAVAPAVALAHLHRLMGGLSRGLDLDETLTAVVECVVAGLGFGVGVVSVVQPGGDLSCAAVAGHDEARSALAGTTSGRAEWDRLLEVAEPVGPGGLLRLVDHRRQGAWDTSVPIWVPEPVAPRAGTGRAPWHPLDALFAPLVSPTAGLLGVLSVDMPVDGLRPSEVQLSLLEMFAVQAAVAVEHARLHTEVVQAQEQARTALATRLQALVDASPAAIVEVDRAGRARAWNRAAEVLLGHPGEAVLGAPLPRLAAPGAPELRDLLDGLQEGRPLPAVLHCVRRDGAALDVELVGAVTTGPDGQPHGAMALLVDVTERRRLQTRLEHQALHDALTGLPNRLLLAERTAQALGEDAARGTCTGVLVVDLDRFKEVNDTLGHAHGDLLLQAVGPRLAEVLRAQDTVARVSGDEFAVLLPGLPDAAGALGAAERVLAALHRPFELEAATVDVEASVGVAVAPLDGTAAEVLLRHADVAMHAAKDLSAGVVAYQPEREAQAPGRLALLGELRRALDAGELVMHYQPKVDVASGEVCGAEALVRWQHPERGLLPPGAFLPVAESTGLIGRLTLTVLDLVLAQVAAWAATGQALPVAVNLSARRLHDAALPDEVARALARHGVPASLLRLEITESAIMSDPDRALAILRRLAAAGVRLSLDDFGTGYSSMSYLRELPVDELKVDRSFVMEMTGKENDGVLVRSAVDLGHNLGLAVVAEGVEDGPTLEALSALGCDIAQGYLLARPMDARGFERWCCDRVVVPQPRGRTGSRARA